MEGSVGLLRINVKRGHDLVIRDVATGNSDPYVVITAGNQKVKTNVVKKNCNPEWNEWCSICVKDLNTPIVLSVRDKDTFTLDDKMGDAEIDIKPYVEHLKMCSQDVPDGTKLGTVQPSRDNCLAEESCIVWHEDKMYQDMTLRLRNAARGEVEIQIEWTELTSHI